MKINCLLKVGTIQTVLQTLKGKFHTTPQYATKFTEMIDTGRIEARLIFLHIPKLDLAEN